MRRGTWFLIAAGVAGFSFSQESASAAYAATASISTSSSSAPYTYDINLKDTGTTTLTQLWFGWIPGQDYLHTPISASNPAGWSNSIFPAGTSDGASIQWNGTLASGSSADFLFSTNDTPAQLAGNSPFYNTTKETTSVISDTNGEQPSVVIAVTPEPGTLGMLAIGLPLLLRRRRRASY